LNDFDALQSNQVRNLYTSPSDLEEARLKSNVVGSVLPSRTVPGTGGVRIGGVDDVINATNETVDGSVNNNDSNGDAAHNSFHKLQRRERELELLESNRPTVRPLRLLPVGKKQPLSEEDKAFLREARLKHFP